MNYTQTETEISIEEVREDVENWLQAYEVLELKDDTIKKLREFKNNPKKHKWQIKYYSLFLEILGGY